jgi:ABC-type ATPase involved in cell division
VVFQDGMLLERLTALENVAYALRVADLAVHVRNARRRAAEVLTAVGLGERLDAYPRQLSGGQRQRVAIARALAPRPPILLADEPTASLDDENAENVMSLLKRAARDGTAVLVATCDRDLPAAYGRRVTRLVRGEVVELIDGGPLEDLTEAGGVSWALGARW